MSWSVSSGSLTSAPNAHRIDRLRLDRGDPRARLVVVDRRRLVDVDAQLAGGDGDRRRADLAAAALLGVGARDDERRAVRGRRRGARARRRRSRRCRGRRSRTRRRRPRLPRARRAGRACASLRWSRGRAVEDQDAVEVVHLVLDDPRLQAARPRRAIVLALLVLGADAHVDRALDVDVDGGQAQAALLGPLLVLAGPLDHGVDQRVDRAVGLDAVDEHAVQDADLGGGEADAVARRASARPSGRSRRAARRRSDRPAAPASAARDRRTCARARAPHGGAPRSRDRAVGGLRRLFELFVVPCDGSVATGPVRPPRATAGRRRRVKATASVGPGGR